MGADIHVKVTIFDEETLSYKEIKLFNENQIFIPVYIYRNYTFFDMIKEVSYPLNVKKYHPDIQTEYYDLFEVEGYTGFYDPREISFAHLINIGSKNKKIKTFCQRIKYYLEFAGYDEEYIDPGEIKIVFWFDN